MATGPRKTGIRRLGVASAGDLAAVARSRREELGLTLVQVAEIAGTSRFFVSDLERGKPSVQLDKVLAVANALQMRIELKAGAPRRIKAAVQAGAGGRGLSNAPAVAPDQAHDDPETIACAECGLRVRNLTRHLSSAHSMRTGEYRRRWGLGDGYDLRPRAVAEQDVRRRQARAALSRQSEED